MELRHYASLLRHWWWLLVLLALIGGVVAFGVGLLNKPVYEASTTVLINQAPGALPTADAVLAGQRVATTYAELLHQRPVMEAVIKNLELDMTPDDLEKQVQVSTVRDTNLLVLSVQDSDPARAASIANEIVRVFIEQNIAYQASRFVTELESLQSQLDAIQKKMDDTQLSIDALKNATDPEKVAERSRLQGLLNEQITNYTEVSGRYVDIRLAQTQTTDRVSVVEEALPGQRVTSNILNVTFQGVILGLVLAVGVILLTEYLRDTVKSGEELEQITGKNTLGVIGIIQNNEPSEVLVVAKNPRSPIAETYRLLRANIEFSAVGNPIRTMVITSCSPEEGKSTTASNLAIATAQTGKRVILVDTDLRRPTLHKLFGQSNSNGLSMALLQETGKSLRDHAVPTGIDNLVLLPSGPLPPNPAELLGSPRMAELIDELKSMADIVFFDTPPVLAVADSTLLARACDATLLIVLADSTKGNMLRKAATQITQAGAHLAGTVLNKVRTSSDGYYYYYHKYYSSTEN